MVRQRSWILLLLLAWMPAGISQASADDLWRREYFTGDWGGARTWLIEHGVGVNAAFTGDSFTNFSGGLRRGTAFLDDFDLLLGLDLERLAGCNETSFFLYGLGTQGTNPSERYVGDAQGVSNIAAYSTWKVYEAWVERNFRERGISLLVGLYDLNTEFDALESAGLFLNSSQGIGPEFAQSGLNGPSIFPTTTLGLRAKWAPGSRFYLESVVLNGLAGNPSHPDGTHIVLTGKPGILSTTEFAYLRQPSQSLGPGRQKRSRIARFPVPGHVGKIAVGGWFYTARFNAIYAETTPGSQPLIGGNHGLYMAAEQTVYGSKASRGRCLTLFARAGVANSRINRFGSFTGGGLVFQGLLPRRSLDESGVALAGAHNGAEYREAQAASGVKVEGSEWNIELTYLARLSPWLAVKFDLQHVINPNTNPALKNATAFGLRLQIVF